MVQSQLTDYVASQIKLGVSRDAIKSALVGAGWMEADVEDTLKSVGASAAAIPMAKPASAPASSPMSSPATGASVRSSSPLTGGPQSVRVSDLISASGSATSFAMNSGNAKKMDVKAKAMDYDKPDPKMNMAGSDLTMPAGRPRGKGGLIMKIVGIILILGFGGAAGYFYYQNLGLSSQITSLGGESNNVNAQLSSLNTQMQVMTASNTALSSQIDSLTMENGMLVANLSFAVVPPLGKGTGPETISIAGTLALVKSAYQLMTPYGVLVFVQNSKDPKVDSALKPLLASTSSVTLAGTHVPGTQYLTVTTVNGNPLASPAPVPSTSTSTVAATSSAPSAGQ